MTVEPLNATSARVSWRSLDSQDVSGYRVYYSLVSGPESRRKRQGFGEESVRVSSEEDPSVVVGGLEEGRQYQFEVVALVVVSGVEREGEQRSEETMVWWEDSKVRWGAGGAGGVVLGQTSMGGAR